MSDFEYSDNAKLILPKFDIDSRTIRIYVEGKDDIPFWDGIFNDILPENFSLIFEEKGGAKGIYKLLDNVANNQTFIAALDSEYDEIIHDKKRYKNKLTIFTRRHSIENYLFCAHSLEQIIKRLNRTSRSYISDIMAYIIELSNLLEILLYLDCLKYVVPNRLPNNISILGGNSTIAKFSNNNAIYPEEKKIKNFIQFNKLDNINVKDIKKLFIGKNIYHFLNGHFITFSIGQFVTSKLNTRKIANDTLYDNAYNNCLFCKVKCSDYNEIKNQAQTIIRNYINNI